jgi:hypothetical protein
LLGLFKKQKDDSMWQKTLCVLALFAALLFSGCGEISVIDLSNEKPREAAKEAGNSSVEKEDGIVIVDEDATTPPEQILGELQPFDESVFTTKRAAWEASSNYEYGFTQTHSGPGIYLSTDTTVVDGIPTGTVVLSGVNEPEPLLFCNTISELYKRINTLWSEQRYTGASFLIQYNNRYNYPVFIQIKNIDDSGGDYTLRIGMYVWITNWW